MKYAIAKWVRPLVLVEVSPAEFLAPGGDELLLKLQSHFMVDIAMLTQIDGEMRTLGVPFGEDLLADDDMVWRPLVLPPEAEIPF